MRAVAHLKDPLIKTSLTDDRMLHIFSSLQETNLMNPTQKSGAVRGQNE